MDMETHVAMEKARREAEQAAAQRAQEKQQQAQEKQLRDEEASRAFMQQHAEGLRRSNQERQDALQARQDALDQRIQRAYQGWESVPDNLCTRAQLKRERLRIPSGTRPVAEVYAYRPGKSGRAFFDLYRRADAVKIDKNARIHNVEPMDD